MDYEKLQAKLATLAVTEANLRIERKALEHQLAEAKKDRPYSGPVTGADGNPLDHDTYADAINSSAIEGVAATADAAGKGQ
jgi:hypothetical protein